MPDLFFGSMTNNSDTPKQSFENFLIKFGEIMEKKTIDELSSLFDVLIEKIKEGFSSSSELEPELSKFISQKNEYSNFLKKRFLKADKEMQSRIMTLMSSISDKSLAPLLKKIIEEKFLNIEFKLKAANILSFIDKAFDEKLLIELGEAAKFMDEIHSSKEPFSESEFSVLSESFLKIKKDLGESVLNQLVEETGEKSLQFISRIILKDPSLDLFIIGLLKKAPSPEKIKILNDIYEKSTEGNIKNAVKKSFFALKQKGFIIETAKEKKKEESPVFKPHAPKGEGYLSIIDPDGNQLLVFTIPPVKLSHGVICFQAVINYDEGIKDFRAVEITKKNFKNYIINLLGNKNFLIVETTSDYCKYLLKESAAKTQTPPQGYIECQPFLDEKNIHFEQPLIYQNISHEEIKTKNFSESQIIQLLNIPEFEGLNVNPVRIEKYTDKMEEIEGSKIIINQYQKEERITDLIFEASKEVFDINTKETLKRKLEEISFVLYKTGKEEEAKLALFTAINISESFEPEKNLFLLELLKKSILKVKSIKEDRRKEEPSLIYKP
ncbi:MAG: hypothetical protein A2W05_08270 [Candidatus Schekmanbacteria bacterium RBG_16_38_10]|uniref:Uncharacterized protein n=1 Tax=Candidatus Schekmanbacteria bacterium RBG_16_38_10 TaxID=1817879 RepID=A0A1F7RSU1_9BACT|nr:MAG: hypothetical protein A2W05_08270 [Candidatus Schekmanbacteria bacterium RBG_16_38_10]